MSRKLTLHAKDPSTLVLSGLDDFLCSLLREVPESGFAHPDADARLFPSPTAGRDPEADQEWREFVRPDLEEQFAWNRNRVADDLLSLRFEAHRGAALDIPMENLPAWIHALNQARLCLSAQFKLGDEEGEEEGSDAHPAPEGVAVFQMQFYGLLQEWFLAASDTL